MWIDIYCFSFLSGFNVLQLWTRVWDPASLANRNNMLFLCAIFCHIQLQCLKFHSLLRRSDLLYWQSHCNSIPRLPSSWRGKATWEEGLWSECSLSSVSQGRPGQGRRLGRPHKQGSQVPSVSDSPSCIPQQRRGGEADPGLAWEFPSASCSAQVLNFA